MTKAAKFLVGAVAGSALALGGMNWLNSQTKPTEPGEPFLLRFEGVTLDEAAGRLEEKGVIRNASLFVFLAKLERRAVAPQTGTYEFRAGMTSDQVVASMKTPLRQMVRIPEGWWIARVAKRLEEKGVCSAQEYIDACHDPEKFEGAVGFALPSGSLEGYLYPDTYDLPPMLGAEGVVRRQLAAFESKVVETVGEEGLARALVVGSMVEAEAALDVERPKVAGVIENRIKRGQRLEIDATVLYGMQEWRQLKPGEVRQVDSPYNTYLHGGLPPGPICSPSVKSIEAALKPDTHDFLYYVARPTRSHYFSATYQEHLAAIRKARGEFRESEAGS